MELDSCLTAPPDWPRRTISEICERFTSGGTPSRARPEFYGGRIPWVKTKELTDRTLWNAEECITEAGLAGSSAKLLPAGTVLMAMYGATVGKLGRLGVPMACNQACAAMVVDGNRADASYLYFQLKLNRSKIVSSASGAAQQNLSGLQIKNFILPFPGVREQRLIGGLLASLDEKIELNRRMNETLEAMAQAIFRDWFVDFGPVRRKMEGATDPVAIMGGLTSDPARAAELAGLFPDGLGEHGLPVGWSERPLDQIAEFLNGLALQKFPAVSGEPSLPVIKIAELRNGLTDKSNRASYRLPEKYIVHDGDYIFSWSGSLMAKVWAEGDGALNQHLFKVSSKAYPQWFYAGWVEHHLPEFRHIAASKATTMGHIQRGHLSSAMTVCPPKVALQAMSEVLVPLWDRRVNNDLENRTLAETRDYLLPRLMSGQVRIGDSEAMVA